MWDGEAIQDGGLSNTAFSSVVSTIYDCALDPALWPEAIREVCRLSNFAAGMIDVAELSSRSMRLHQQWNYEPGVLERAFRDYGEEIAGYWAGVPNLMTRPLDEPLCVSRVLTKPVMIETRYYREWV